MSKKSHNKSDALSKVRLVKIVPPSITGMDKDQECCCEEGEGPYQVHMIVWNWDGADDLPAANIIKFEAQSVNEGLEMYRLADHLVSAFDGLITLLSIFPSDRCVNLWSEPDCIIESVKYFQSVNKAAVINV